MNTPVKLSTFERFKQSGFLDDVPDDIAPKLVDVICNQVGTSTDMEWAMEYQIAITKAIMLRFPTELIEVFKTPAALTRNNAAKVVFTSRYFINHFTKEEIMKKDPAMLLLRAEECVRFLFETLLVNNYSTIYIYNLFNLFPVDGKDIKEDKFASCFRAVFE